jgi:hypothetical protein
MYAHELQEITGRYNTETRQLMYLSPKNLRGPPYPPSKGSEWSIYQRTGISDVVVSTLNVLVFLVRTFARLSKTISQNGNG